MYIGLAGDSGQIPLRHLFEAFAGVFVVAVHDALQLLLPTSPDRKLNYKNMRGVVAISTIHHTQQWPPITVHEFCLFISSNNNPPLGVEVIPEFQEFEL